VTGSEVAPKRLRQNFFMAIKKLSLCLFLSISFILSNTQILAAYHLIEAQGSAELLVFQFNNKPIIDDRVKKLESYLTLWQSPLTSHAEIFINSADKYQLDWTLVAAIAGVESSFGKRVPINSYNAWGWNNGNYRFDSWEQGIDHVNQVLREKYYDRGLKTIRQIGPTYAPPSTTWANKVTYFKTQLEQVNLPASEQLALNLD